MVVSAAIILALVSIILWVILNRGQRRKSGFWSKNGIAEIGTEPSLRRMIKGHLNTCDSDTKIYGQMKKKGLPYGGVYEVRIYGTIRIACLDHCFICSLERLH